MFDTEGHESHKLSADLGQARDAYLSPTSNAFETVDTQPSQKRKGVHGYGIGEAIVIESHPSLPSPQEQELIPRLQLPRSCLPLSYLDPLGGPDDHPCSNLFSAHIAVLEKNVGEDRWSNRPMLLIAQSAIDDRLFAIERVQEGVYAMCRLGDWVSVNAFERSQTIPIDVVRPQKRQCKEQPGPLGDRWWSVSALNFERGHRYEQIYKPGVDKARGVRLCLHSARQKPIEPAQVTQQVSQPISQDHTGNVWTDVVETAAQDPEEVFNMVRVQYQEALYASRLSLAYFAKGPLSRARAAFSAPDSPAINHSRLTSFLRSCILPLTIMDTKYREALPELVKELPFESLSDDERATVIETMSKKTRKSKKINLGKNGLYPGEEANIARWWLSRDLSSIACDSTNAREEANRSAVLEQRARETQMQIILSLETLALESLSAVQSAGRLCSPALIKEKDSSLDKKKKAKKPQDLNMVLDLLVDRLCIWQSMSVDETKISSSEDRPTSQQGANSTTKAAGSDHLRQFCIDVVLPFYGARLPELTTLLCQKLGGPKQPSPRRPALVKSASSCLALKPGASMQKQQIRKPRRTLERVMTDERSASQKPPPSLSRCATDPVLPQVKSENSDTPLSSIPLNRVAMHKRYSQREVDLQATSRAAEAKLKKKARVEQELQGAIAALKKPNPRMAVKELFEDAEKRAAASHSRKPKNPVRNPLAQGAQVMATPSNNRHKDVYGGLSRLPRQSRVSLHELEEVPPSSISCVPSSSRKAQRSPVLAPDSTRKTGSSALPIAETPTRGPSKLWDRPPSIAALESGAATIHPSLLSAVSRLPKVSDDSCNSADRSLLVHETPPKFRFALQIEQPEVATTHATSAIAPFAADKPSDSWTKAISSPLSQEKEKSIYAALGWDDDVDELL